ncbi:hypothetical protein C484_13790 [Natrialba taiwanensis DSM 12281]|uniref:Uncharacterized protein n=1 Tax=Natrialba taiwanensis DSM 12281 TaxID=1230458 RepID=L9ZTF2_9EURY|nr:hypothetical protein C484_13790 [Natrialba taiwanensis DSM 12281]
MDWTQKMVPSLEVEMHSVLLVTLFAKQRRSRKNTKMVISNSIFMLLNISHLMVSHTSGRQHLRIMMHLNRQRKK